jgi:hypothetical protein
MRRFLVVLLAVLMVGMLLYAKDLEGVSMPDKITVGDATLSLNGMGLRIKKIAFIGIKVYVAGLYVATPSSDAGAIIKADEPKQMVMHFLYKEVGKGKLVDGWNEGFEKNSGDKMAALKARLDKFNAYWPDMKTGDEAVMTYVPGVGTKVEIKGQEMGVIEGRDFAEALFAVWLGPEPPNKEMKEGLLGK